VGENAFPQYPDCCLCADKGLHHHTGVYAFCKCAAGERLRAETPGIADEANAAEQRLNENVGSAGQ